MRAFERAGTDVQWRCNDPLDPERLKPDADSNDVYDRIDGAHLMKMDRVNGDVVDFRFSFAQSLKDCLSLLFDGLRKPGCADYLFDPGKRSVIVMVIMSMIMAMLMTPFFFNQSDIELGCRDSAAIDAVEAQLIALHAKLRQFGLEVLKIQPAVQQRAEQHVAARSGKTIKIESV
jgi:hypothetical protein